jgi:hypothetical protein
VHVTWPQCSHPGVDVTAARETRTYTDSLAPVGRSSKTSAGTSCPAIAAVDPPRPFVPIGSNAGSCPEAAVPRRRKLPVLNPTSLSLSAIAPWFCHISTGPTRLSARPTRIRLTPVDPAMFSFYPALARAELAVRYEAGLSWAEEALRENGGMPALRLKRSPLVRVLSSTKSGHVTTSMPGRGTQVSIAISLEKHPAPGNQGKHRSELSVA